MSSIRNTLLLGLASGSIANFAHAASPGCGKKPAGKIGATTSFNITSADLKRHYMVHVPSGYKDDKPYPVVFGFHGSGETAWEFEQDTRLSQEKWSKEKIMVYPDGIGKTWAGASYSNATIPEDLSFVTDMLEDLREGYCVDDNKIYATGLSNGAGFVDLLACDTEVGGNFAAFVPCSGAYYLEHLYNSTYDCNPARSPIPITFVHGMEDKTVPYNGAKQGNGGFLPAVSIVVDKWAERNKCTKLTIEETFKGAVHHSSWDCAGTKGVLQHYREDDMDHVWASQDPTFSQLILSQPPTKMEANKIIMDFFDRFSLNNVKNDTTPDDEFTIASSVLLPTTQDLGTVAPNTATFDVATLTGLLNSMTASPDATATGTATGGESAAMATAAATDESGAAAAAPTSSDSAAVSNGFSVAGVMGSIVAVVFSFL